MNSHPLPAPRSIAFLVAALLSASIPMRAADRFAAIPERLQDFVDRGEIAGAVALVADKERILHLGAVGSRDLASGAPMQTDDLFAIASMTKPITAVAVAILVDEGRLAFDDPVEKHLPEFRDPWVIVEQTKVPRQRVLVPSPRPITVRDLLTHTSGLAPLELANPHWTLSEAAKVLSREPLRFLPGTGWEYCDSGFLVLGRIVEVAGGEPFEVLLQRRIFGPLGMKDTTFRLNPDRRARLARAYRRNSESGTLEEYRPPSATRATRNASLAPPAGCSPPPRTSRRSTR